MAETPTQPHYHGANRRRFSRIEYFGVANVRTNRQSVAAPCRLRNLSVGGVCLRLEEPFELHSVVDITLTPWGEAHPVVCRGRINWITTRLDLRKQPPIPNDVGIEFVELNPLTRERLMRMLHELQQLREAPAYAEQLKPITIQRQVYFPLLRPAVREPGRWELAVYEGEQLREKRTFTDPDAAMAYWAAFKEQLAHHNQPAAA